jgi:hypothetical protein
MGNFYSFCVFLHEFFAILMTFSQIFAETRELLASICAVGVPSLLLLTSLLFLASLVLRVSLLLLTAVMFTLSLLLLLML